MREPKQPDTQAMIDHCLACPFDHCWNCLGQHNLYSYGLRIELDERFRRREARAVLKAAMARKEAENEL